MSIFLKTINVISILSLSLFLNMCTNSQSGTIRKDVTDLLNNAGYEVSSFSKMYYEDLPTDRFGAEFGANYFDPDSELTFAEQLQNYLIYVLLAIDPQNAPNYDNLPEDYPKRPTRTNNTTNPVYVNDNL